MKIDVKKSLITCTVPMSSVDCCLAPLRCGPAPPHPYWHTFVESHLVNSVTVLVSYFVLLSFWFYRNILLLFIYTYPQYFNHFPYTFFWWGQKGACGEARDFITTFSLLHLHWDNLSFWAPRENLQGWKNPGFQSSHAIFPNFTWKEMVNEWQNTLHQTNGKSTKCYILSRLSSNCIAQIWCNSKQYIAHGGHEQERKGHFFWSPPAVLICSAELNVNRYCALLLVSNCIIFHKFTCVTAENHESYVFFSSTKYYLFLILGWPPHDI